MRDTRTTLQLANRSIVRPIGVIKDLSVGIDKFVLPCDFIIIEEKIDSATPMILGRPFLATGDAWMGIKYRTITFQINGESVVFNMDQAMKYAAESQCIN